MESGLPLAVTSSFFSCCRTKLCFSVVSSQGKCFWFGKTPNDVVVFTYIAATVRRLSSINLKPAFSYSAVDSSCQLVFVPKRCVSWWLSDSLAVCSQRSGERFCESVCMLVTNFRNSFEYCFCFYSLLDLNLNILLDLNWNIPFVWRNIDDYRCDVTQHDAIFLRDVIFSLLA